MEKTCKKCDETKPVDCFTKQKKAKGGFCDWCRDCVKLYRKVRYDSNIEENRRVTNKNRAERIAWHQDLKRNKPCLDCGKIYEPYCMDYDHVPSKGVKFKNVSRMVLDNSSVESILVEIEKCDLVCLLCHNIRTIKRINERNNNPHRSHIIRNIKIINSHKDNPCVICGIKYDSCNMQLDHIDPENKKNNVSALKSAKEKDLLEEISKCQVICAMCHRIKSINEQLDKKYKVRIVEVKKKRFYDENQKECSRCEVIKDNIHFKPNKLMKCGFDTYCKTCWIEYKRERRKRK